MNMKLSEVLIRQRVLSGFAELKLPYQLGHAISKNLLKLQEEVKIIDEMRIKIIKDYAVKDQNGEPVIIDGQYELGSNKEGFNKEYSVYLGTDTELDILTVSAESLNTADDSRFDVLTVAQIAALDFMI